MDLQCGLGSRLVHNRSTTLTVHVLTYWQKRGRRTGSYQSWDQTQRWWTSDDSCILCRRIARCNGGQTLDSNLGTACSAWCTLGSLSVSVLGRGVMPTIRTVTNLAFATNWETRLRVKGSTSCTTPTHLTLGTEQKGFPTQVFTLHVGEPMRTGIGLSSNIHDRLHVVTWQTHIISM